MATGLREWAKCITYFPPTLLPQKILHLRHHCKKYLYKSMCLFYQENTDFYYSCWFLQHFVCFYIWRRTSFDNFNYQSCKPKGCLCSYDLPSWHHSFGSLHLNVNWSYAAMSLFLLNSMRSTLSLRTPCQSGPDSR